MIAVDRFRRRSGMAGQAPPWKQCALLSQWTALFHRGRLPCTRRPPAGSLVVKRWCKSRACNRNRASFVRDLAGLKAFEACTPRRSEDTLLQFACGNLELLDDCLRSGFFRTEHDETRQPESRPCGRCPWRRAWRWRWSAGLRGCVLWLLVA